LWKLNTLHGHVLRGLVQYIQGGPKESKPLPNDQKIVLNRINNLSMILDLFVILQYESSTITLFVCIRYSMRDLLSDLNNYA